MHNKSLNETWGEYLYNKIYKLEFRFIEVSLYNSPLQLSPGDSESPD